MAIQKAVNEWLRLLGVTINGATTRALTESCTFGGWGQQIQQKSHWSRINISCEGYKGKEKDDGRKSKLNWICHFSSAHSFSLPVWWGGISLTKGKVFWRYIALLLVSVCALISFKVVGLWIVVNSGRKGRNSYQGRRRFYRDQRNVREYKYPFIFFSFRDSNVRKLFDLKCDYTKPPNYIKRMDFVTVLFLALCILLWEVGKGIIENFAEVWIWS